MEINGKKYKIGPWAKPYIEELLRGNYVHDPTLYVGGMHNKHYRGNIRKYRQSWDNALMHLKEAGYLSFYIFNQYGSDPIYILINSFPEILQTRLVDQKDHYRLYQLENRRLLFLKEGFSEFTVVSTRKDIETILTERVENALDGAESQGLVPSIPRYVTSKPVFKYKIE